ncbi:transporter substrate-binding domain-containing protein [Gordonia sp. (in: high G+C Gram-positive bacteria)]|uniref:transporter substrate-binding domain-containing protein n=1 Tax=Gordonia sp. (in: high G+C Gram-positive bacteria) TaxID=84139 RepID=UPI003C71DD13
MRLPLPVKRIVVACAATTLAVGAAGCSSPESTPAPTSSSSATARPFDAAALKAQLPERIRTSGTLLVGTQVPFAPMEFEENGKLTGFDIDLVNAIARQLGLTAEVRAVGFPDLFAGVESGTFDTVAAGLSDTVEREQRVDMVSYLRAGTQWAQRAGDAVAPHDACGVKVGAEADSVQFTLELPAKSQACEAVGEKPLDVVGFVSDDAALTALAAGEVDAVSADSPVIRYAAHRSDGKIVAIGKAFDTMPYALPVAKGSPLGPILQQVVQHLIDSGEMKTLTQRWGLGGLIETSAVNAAMN